MSTRMVVSLGLKVIALTFILFLCFTLSSLVLGRYANSNMAPEEARTAGVALLTACFLNVCVLSYVILRSRWAGWRLVATVWFVIYGVMTVMGQMESAVFITRLPHGLLPRLFLMGLLTAASFSPLAVLILGKRKPDGATAEPNMRLEMPKFDWAWKLTAIALVYVVLYFTFGYFVAWKNPVVREYYNGTDVGAFFPQMKNLMRETPWLPFFQMMRAMMWALLALPVIRMMKGRWWEAGLAVSLLFAVVMNSQLLLPNPYMPGSVRMSHLVETASSNFIFGWCLGWLLARAPGTTKEAAVGVN